jgi:hypothetical protein
VLKFVGHPDYFVVNRCEVSVSTNIFMIKLWP